MICCFNYFSYLKLFVLEEFMNKNNKASVKFGLAGFGIIVLVILLMALMLTIERNTPLSSTNKSTVLPLRNGSCYFTGEIDTIGNNLALVKVIQPNDDSTWYHVLVGLPFTIPADSLVKIGTVQYFFTKASVQENFVFIGL